MGPSEQQDDPMLRLRYYKETGQADEAKHYEQYLRETGQYHDTAQGMSDLLTEQGILNGPVAAAPAGPPVRADNLAALARNRPNASGDFQAATRNPGQQARFVGNVAASHALNTLQGIPGVEAAEAGIGSMFSPMSYEQSLGALRGRIKRDVGPAAGLEKFAMAAPLAAVLPGNPAVAGALLGGADQALSADPIHSLGDVGWRAAKTVGGAAAGYGVGKLADVGVTSLRSLAAKNPAKALIQAQAERAVSAKQLYGAALSEGRNNEATQAIRNFVSDPELAPRVQALQAMEQFKHTPADSPEMLDALYKSLSDEAKQIGKGLAGLDPSKPNTGRFRQANVVALKDRLLNALERPGVKPPLTLDVAPEVFETAPSVVNQGRDAMTGPVMEGTAGRARGDASQVALDPSGRAVAVSPRDVQGPAGPAFQLRAQPEKVTPGVRIETPGMRVQTAPAEAVAPMMPSYRAAVEDYAKRTADIEALKRGYGAVRNEMAGGLPAPNNLGKKDAAGFAEWAKNAKTSEIQNAQRGILGATSDAYGLPGKTLAPGRRAAGVSGDLLRSAPTDQQQFIDLLQKLGLLAGNTAITNR